MKIGIFYGSTTDTTRRVAEEIAKALKVKTEDIHDVAHSFPSELGKYDLLVLGTPTYGVGELQDDWYDFIAGAEVLDLSGKKIALFGTGDVSFTDTFCNAVGELYDRMRNTGATFVGEFNTYPYEFDNSLAVAVPGAGAVGLLIDNVNYPDETSSRISEWAKKLL